MPRPILLVLLVNLACTSESVVPDTGGTDAKPPPDASDTGLLDGGVTDTGADTGMDAGAADVGPSDGGADDTGVADTGAPGPGTFVGAASLVEGPRQETAVVALGGEIYVIGGYDENAQFGALVEVYDPQTDMWRRAADLPIAMHHANAAAAADKLYVLGFLGPGFGHSGRTFEYDPALNEWTELQGMPPTRARGSAVTMASGGLIYLVGGLRNLASVADADVYDPSTDSFSPLPPLPRLMDHGVGGAIDGRLYVAGGRAGGIAAHTDQLDVFDLGTGQWTLGPPMPTSRGGAAGAVLAGTLYVFGGEGNRANPNTGLFEQVEGFDAAANVWRMFTPMDPPRHGMAAAAVADRIYIPGGATVEAFGATDIHEVFVP